MQELGRKIRKSKKLVRIREITEQHAQVEAFEAASLVEAKAGVELRQHHQLDELETDFLQATEGGVSLQSFMRFASLRDLHVHAVDVAQKEWRKAERDFDVRQAELLSAAHQRRAAERMLGNMETRQSLVLRRAEQSETDEMNCARATRRLTPS